MPKYFKATIEVLVAADTASEACDALAEGFRPMLREFAPESSWIDWRYSDNAGFPCEYDGDGFEYA
jgi:hypothetical protein